MSKPYPCGGMGRRGFLASAALPLITSLHASAQEPKLAAAKAAAGGQLGIPGPYPGRVIEVIENPVPRPRTEEQLLAPEFLALKHRLDELIHTQSSEPEEEKLPMIKFTEAGNEVE